MAIQDILNKLISEPRMDRMRQTIVDGLEQVYKDATAKGDTNMEVLRARGSSPSLNGRLDDSDNQLKKIENVISQKTDENFVNEKIAIAKLEAGLVDTTNFVVKTELNENINPLEEVMYNDYLTGLDLFWVDQYISNTTGNGTASNLAIRSSDFPSNEDVLLLVSNGSSYTFRVAKYNSEWVFEKMLKTDERIDRMVFKKGYYRLSVFKKDKTVMTELDKEQLKKSISIKKLRLTDSELIEESKNKNNSYSGLSSYILNRLSYVPFSNSYMPKIAFVDDDGYESVLTKTIPLFESKNLPLSVACWSTSHVFDTTANKELLISKLGTKIEIAQHTVLDMVGKTEDELRIYFDEQIAFWSTNAIPVSSMVYGYNQHDAMLRCVVSDYFKLACQGTNATLSNNANRYALNRVRVQVPENLNAYKAYVDSAITKKESLVFFWHSNEIDTNVELYNCLVELLEYVKTKNTQINPVKLSDIL